jgi:hypothetical protein
VKVNLFFFLKKVKKRKIFSLVTAESKSEVHNENGLCDVVILNFFLKSKLVNYVCAGRRPYLHKGDHYANYTFFFFFFFSG